VNFDPESLPNQVKPPWKRLDLLPGFFQLEPRTTASPSSTSRPPPPPPRPRPRRCTRSRRPILWTRTEIGRNSFSPIPDFPMQIELLKRKQKRNRNRFC
jgi:hypothetical protein